MYYYFLITLSNVIKLCQMFSLRHVNVFPIHHNLHLMIIWRTIILRITGFPAAKNCSQVGNFKNCAGLIIQTLWCTFRKNDKIFIPNFRYTVARWFSQMFNLDKLKSFIWLVHFLYFSVYVFVVLPLLNIGNATLTVQLYMTVIWTLWPFINYI